MKNKILLFVFILEVLIREKTILFLGRTRQRELCQKLIHFELSNNYFYLDTLIWDKLNLSPNLLLKL